MKFTLKRLLGKVRKAVQDYNMIESGDRIAVGVSGGKDSITLLTALAHLRKFYPEKFQLEAVTLDLGLDNMDFSSIRNICSKLGVNYTVEKTQIGKIVFDIRNEKNPCSMCANLRRGAINNVAERLDCNKVALGHNKDDVIETFLLSTFYEGRINTFSPVTWLDRKKITVIRPLAYVFARDVMGFVNKQGLKPLKSPCKMNKATKRQVVRDYLSEMAKENKYIRHNIFGAITRSEINGWRRT